MITREENLKRIKKFLDLVLAEIDELPTEKRDTIRKLGRALAEDHQEMLKAGLAYRDKRATEFFPTQEKGEHK